MALQILLRMLALASFLSLTSMCAPAQDMNSLKAGVVRISNAKSGEVGTGFIVKVLTDRIYVVTSSHVVSGNQHPDVYLYNRQQDPLPATVLDREEDGLKGLALLMLKSNQETFSGLPAFSLMNSSQLNGGEDTKVIGFPSSTSIWTVSSATIARIEGRNLVFSGAIIPGNSGGPVILNGRVIGLVTDVSQVFAYAARSESILSYVNGIVKDLIASPDAPTVVSIQEFCPTLVKLLEASKDDFYPIVGAAIESIDEEGESGTFHSKILMPGASDGTVRPQKGVDYVLMTDKDKSKVESQFYSTVSRVKACLPKWEEKDETDSDYRYSRFKESRGTTVVAAYYNPVAQNGNYFLIFAIDLNAAPVAVPIEEFCPTLAKLLESSKGGFYSIVGASIGSADGDVESGTFHAKILMPGASDGTVRPQKSVSYILLIDKNKNTVESLFYSTVSRVKGCLPNWEESEQTDSAYRYHRFKESSGTTTVVVYYNPVDQNGNYFLIFNVEKG